jgi:hypothetical protein
MAAVGRLAKAEHALIVAWAVVLIRLAWPGAVPLFAGAAIMAVFLVLAAPLLNRRTTVLCAIIGLAALLLAAWSGGWWPIVVALDNSTQFGAFFGTIMVLRATADRRPETGKARELFKRLTVEQRSGAFLVGSHLMGALLVVGALAILAPIQGPDASERERRSAAEAAQRGMCLTPLWSPFWIAMAVAYQYVPGVPLWQVLATGLGLSVVGLVLAHMMFASELGLVRLWQAVAGLAPIVPPVALCAAVIVLVTSFSSLSTLQSVIVCTPLLCLAALAAMGGNAIVAAIRGIHRGIGGMKDEVSLVTVSLALGKVLETTLSHAGITEWVGSLHLAPETLIPIVAGVVGLTSLIGIHQLVSITVLLVLLAPVSGGLAPVLLMEAALLGWGISSMVGITAVSVAVAGTMFRVPMDQLSFGPNLKFAAAFGVLACVIMMAANRLVF